jgi:ribosomal protein S12 methylthiotransferase accessory factor
MTPAELRELAGPLAALVSDRTGVIRSVTCVQRGAEEPSPPIICQAELSHFDFRAAKPLDRTTVGKGVTREQAIRGAIGEAVERYCSAQADSAVQVVASFRDLAPRAISPAELVLYDDAQYNREGFPFHRWDPDDQVTWVPAREFSSGSSYFVPASLVYLQPLNGRREDAVAGPSSNGLAAGPDLDFALLHAFNECIERDAFLITWMARLPAPEVDFAGVHPLATSIHDHYLRYGTKLRVFRMYTDIESWVMLAVALDQTGSGPAAIVGLGCDGSPWRALEKSVFEICQSHSGEAHRYREEPPHERLRKPENVRTLVDHSAWFTIREHLGGLSFLLDNGRSERLADLPDYSAPNLRQELERCITSLQRAGCKTLYADLTTPDIRDFGLRVVRAIATGLQPIHFGYGEERLAGRRPFELPEKLGLANRELCKSDLNPIPHPLA